MLLGAWTVIELRVVALNYDLRLPAFPPDVAAQTAQSIESDMESAQGLLSPRDFWRDETFFDLDIFDMLQRLLFVHEEDILVLLGRFFEARNVDQVGQGEMWSNAQ